MPLTTGALEILKNLIGLHSTKSCSILKTHLRSWGKRKEGKKEQGVIGETYLGRLKKQNSIYSC